MSEPEQVTIPITPEQAHQLASVLAESERAREKLSLVFSCILAAAGQTEGTLVGFEPGEDPRVVVRTAAND